METVNDYMNFIPDTDNSRKPISKDLWFIFKGTKLLLKKNDNIVTIPRENDINTASINSLPYHYLGKLNGIGCYCTETTDKNIYDNINFNFAELRGLVGILDHELFMLAGKAIQIINWDKSHKYCGRCGTLTENVGGQRSKKCPRCNFIAYPRISPAIIVAISKGDTILLAHNNSFVQGLYTVLAGFAEPGETLEQCVIREVYEEVGIKVKNIKYFGSEPWPFPDSLMIAFTAEYMEGTINIDGAEIGDANWYKADELPQIPAKGCIARELIESFKIASNCRH